MPNQGPNQGNAYVEPKAAWQVMLNGQDITSLIHPRLVSLRLTLYRHEKADELDIEIEDHDGKMALPPFNATLTVALGWARGTGVQVGLVPMGSFVVDDLTWEGPADKITIKAHSADFKDNFRTRKSRTWTDQTLQVITDTIAGEQGLTNRCHPDLADTTVDAAEQHNQSDMEFLRDLGRRYDAISTVKAGCLLFAPIGATLTASGSTMPTLSLTRAAGDKYSFNRNARASNFKGTEANYYDQDGAIRAMHQEGAAPHKRMKKVYGSATQAQHATRAENKRLKRAAARFETTLALGNPLIMPNMQTTLSGYKSEIDATQWLTAKVEHEMGPTGFRTQIECEVAGATDDTAS